MTKKSSIKININSKSSKKKVLKQEMLIQEENNDTVLEQ